MKKLSILLVSLFTSAVLTSTAYAAGGGGVALDEPYFNMSDKASLQNGAKLFVNYCLSCHSAKYARYNRVAEDLEIPLYRLKENLMFTTEKEGDLMTTTMPEEDSKNWFGVTPPDLTLVSRVRKPNWVYTYLRAFYRDDDSPSGWDNSLFEKVAMPHAMYELQGVQKVVRKGLPIDGSGNLIDREQVVAGLEDGQKLVGNAIFELSHPGEMTPDEFDEAMADLTGFLVYLAEPAIMKRQSIGVYSIVFVLLLMGLCYLLKKEYWRDVH